MAKQTINIGSAPNDGTGTPLRTAFDYCNLNFTELYTAVGPSGNNIVCPGAATITGDLTVDTSTLKVDSANDRVLIGTLTALGSAKLSILGKTQADTAVAGDVIGNFNNTSATGYGLRIGGGSATGGYALSVNNNAGSEFHQISGTGVATWSNVGGVAGTAMTLNATGLGVFNAPVAALDVYKVANDTINRTNATFCFGQMTGLGAGLLGQQSLSAPYQFNLQAANAANSVQFPLVLQPSGGNVGIGVTPSAWSGTFRSLDIGSGALTSQPSQQTIGLYANAFENGTNYTRKALGFAAGYNIYNGAHYWLNAASGAAASTFAFGDAKMTLDASGNLLVGTTSTAGSASNAANLVFGGARTANGSVSATTAVATTIFSITAARTGRYEVVALLGFSGAPAQYTAIATIIWDGNGSRVVANNGANLTITISGSDVQITQTSGSTQTVSWSFLRIAL